MMKRSPIIGYTLGDQAGIGPEVMRAALASGKLPSGVEYRCIGELIDATPGQPTEATALTAFRHLELAAQALNEGAIDAIVTAPVSKEQLHNVGFTWAGQTEFFAERAHCDDYAMCLTGDHLTVGLATIHEALANVPRLLNTPDLVRIGKLLADFCLQKGLECPRIALAGFNPHAGENGSFGTEDALIIAPAVRQLNELNLHARFFGPAVPDAVYKDALHGEFDAILAPYHDQGLIPLKLVDFDNAVNVTLGLPRPRVSPDHGTAFSLAGKGIASAESTISAFKLAVRLVSNGRA